MNLDNIQLPDFVIQDLYKKNLVDLTDEEIEKNNQSKEEGINFFGGNRQQIVLLVDIADTTFLTDHQLTFLTGILNACKLTLEDICLVNIHHLPSASYKIISENFKPRIVLLFGISSAAIDLPFVMPEFQRQTFNNQVYISIPALSELENDKDQKRKLWTVLQQIFSV